MSDYSDLKLMAECATGWTDVSLAPDVLLELINENESLRADSERYQWIRKPENSPDVEHLVWCSSSEEDFDAQIDWHISSPENP